MINVPMTLFMMLVSSIQAQEPQPTHHVVIDIKPIQETKTPEGYLEYEVKLVVHPPFKIQHVKEQVNDKNQHYHTDILITKEEE